MPEASPDAAPHEGDEEAPPGVPITVDGKELFAEPGELLIDAAERNGVYIPRFCYHPRMKPVGMCRMCIVEVDTGRGPALQPSCMLTVAEGMKVDTESERTKKAQDGVLEFLLINHPLDCPVCDKGGECPLQDQTYAYGPGESRFVEEKRHFRKPIPISDVVFLDRERCILCDRCTRFAKEVAGDPLIHFIGRGAQTQVNTFPDLPFSSYFSGNTVQICPVGALTAKPYRFRARPWDLEEVESTCQGCAVGCSITVQSSRNRVLRYLGVDNDATNWGWLCDRGRFGFEAVNSEERLGAPLVRRGGQLDVGSWSQALSQAAAAITAALDDGGPGTIGAIGGARLTNESQYAWARLLKGVVGTDSVDAQLGDGLPAELLLGLPRATIDEACAPGGTIILLGPDPKERLGALYLRLRHAIVNDGARLVEVGHSPSGLSHLAQATLLAAPGELAGLAASLVGEGSNRHLVGDGPVTIILGRPAVTADPLDVAAAATALAQGLPSARFLPALTRANVFGALDMGLAPGLLPGRVDLDGGRATFTEAWGAVPTGRGRDTAGILAAAAAGELSVLVLLGADPIADFPDRALAEAALARVGTVIAVDQFLTDSSSVAHVVLPAAGMAEVSGTTTNLEGRVLQVTQKVTPPGTARADWMIAAELARRLGHDLGFETFEGIWDQVRSVSAPHAAIEAPGADGTLAVGSSITAPTPAAPRAVPADPSTLRLVVRRTMYDAGTLTAHSPSLAGLAPVALLHLSPGDFARLGVADGTPVRVTSVATGAEVVLAAAADTRVPVGTVVAVANLPGVELNRLLSAGSPVTDIRVDRI